MFRHSRAKPSGSTIRKKMIRPPKITSRRLGMMLARSAPAKPVEMAISDTDEPEHRLKKNLGALDLTVFGIGVTIGGGLFVLTGTAAASYAGPAVAVSFVIAAVACALAALCYAEFASTVPVAGSAYTFSYATLGELVAWMIGWDLILEFFVAAAAVVVAAAVSLLAFMISLPVALLSLVPNRTPVHFDFLL